MARKPKLLATPLEKANAQVDQAKVDLSNWEKQAKKFTQELEKQKKVVEGIQAQVGQVMIETGDVTEITAKLGQAHGTALALEDAYKISLQKIEEAKAALWQKEQAAALAEIDEIIEWQKKELPEIVKAAELLEERLQRLHEKACQVHNLKHHKKVSRSEYIDSYYSDLLMRRVHALAKLIFDVKRQQDNILSGKPRSEWD